MTRQSALGLVLITLSACLYACQQPPSPVLPREVYNAVVPPEAISTLLDVANNGSPDGMDL